MYSIKEVTGNLLLVSKIEKEEKTIGNLYIPNSNGKYTICKVIKVGKEVKNENIKENSIVAIPSILVDKTASLDETFNLPKQITINNNNNEKIEVKETDTISEKKVKEIHNKQNSITKKIEYYILQEYSVELILENVEDTP